MEKFNESLATVRAWACDNLSESQAGELCGLLSDVSSTGNQLQQLVVDMHELMTRRGCAKCDNGAQYAMAAIHSKMLRLELELPEVPLFAICHYEPEETYRDANDVLRYGLDSYGWDCSACGGPMMGGDGGWFDTETGQPKFNYCPYCGRMVDPLLTVAVANSVVDDD
jgi:hypothetical protein